MNMKGEFILLGHGFDTVQLSLQTSVPESLSRQIEGARQCAKEKRKEEPAELGLEQVRCNVLRHGGGGGDAMVSTGELGEMWFFKTDQKRDPWGVTVKVRALALLCYGFKAALEHVFARAEAFGLIMKGYSLGRFDYRFDVLADYDFAPEQSRLIVPTRSRLVPYEIVKPGHPLYEWNEDPDVRRILRGTKIETLMVGKIGSGNQLVLYNKRAECIAKRDYALLESYGLDVCDRTWGLWRLEARYAGDVLKRRWNVRDLLRLAQMLQPMLTRTLRGIRYVLPDDRSHPLWTCATDAIPLCTCEQPSQFAPERAEYLLREERSRALEANIAGCALGLAAMNCQDESKVRQRAPELARAVVQKALVANPEKTDEAVRRAWQYGAARGSP